MMMRCNNPKGWGYAEYGAKGIKVCDRWHDFRSFLYDMGERPPGRSIDRIDGTKGYEPGNCRWATRAQQNANRRKYEIRNKNPNQKRSPGRPPLGDKAATARVEFRCTPQEKSGYRKKAGPQGLSAWLKGLADKA